MIQWLLDLFNKWFHKPKPKSDTPIDTDKEELSITKDILPSYCYGSNTITNEGVVIHYFSAVNVDPNNRFDVTANRRLMLDLNRPFEEREWYRMPDYKPRLWASYHYIIPREGSPIQLVPTDKRAYHAGKSEINGRDNLNNWTIGISMLATHTSGFTESQYEWGARLCHRHKIRQNKVWGHEHVSPGRKVDPGPEFDWDKFKRLIQSRYTGTI